MKKKNKRQALEKENLFIWSEIVKYRVHFTCELCGIKGSSWMFDAHHIFTKGSCTNLKYDINNGICLCKGCHRFRVHIKSDPELIPMLIKKRGQDWFDELCKKKHSETIHRTTSDIENINTGLKQILEPLKY